MPNPTVHTWDWRGQPDLDRLAADLAAYGVHLTQLDTGTDGYAIVLSGDPITYAEADAAWDASLNGGQ